MSPKNQYVHDIPGLSGKVIIVTGANKGIGFETVKQLALKGAHVYLGARDSSKAADAISALNSQGVPVANIKWLWVDLSTPRTARMSAEGFIRLQSRLDILINNAAMPPSPYQRTDDGIVDSVSTNYFGPFVFTNILLPEMYQTALEPDSDVRIINLTSSAHKLVANIRIGDPKAFNISCAGTFSPNMARHGFSRLLNILFTKELQRRIDDDRRPIVVMCVYPDTGKINQAARPLSFLRRPLIKSRALSVEQGAYSSLFAATSQRVRCTPEYFKGSYLVPFGEVHSPSETASDMDLAKRLWDATEKVLLRIFDQDEQRSFRPLNICK
ncbi:NAD-binding protein [Hysterangium stoloniferum]|nr:NAD-binding protein [Hysterangium stoloniferum]